MGFSPYVKCICPSCFEEIFLGECRIVSGITTNKVLKTPSKGPLTRLLVEPLNGRKYTLELARRECTNCEYLLPDNVEDVPSITLAVIGDVYSGKSHYIAALIHQLKAKWLGNTNGFARFTCLTPEVEDFYTREYFEPLFINKQALPNTQRATEMTAKPLIYKLVVAPSPKHPPKAVNLIIYDTSGEDFVNQDRLVQFARFVLNTSAFIFVANPVTMPSIFGQLPFSLQTRLQSQFDFAKGQRAADSFSAIIETFERYGKHSDGSSLSGIPVAIMLAKADLLKQLNTQNSYTFMTNPHYSSDLDLQDINTVDQEVRNLLRIYQQGDLLATTNRIKQVKFFATSATGDPPDGNNSFTKVEPCRCLDPVLWILHRLEIIRKLS